jgi:hypothetical protein
MKYFVISLHRTATRSTTAFLVENLHITAAHHPRRFGDLDLRNVLRGHEHDLQFVFRTMRPVVDAFDCVADVPFPVLYPHLNRHYPESRFILLHRDPKVWLRSVRNKLKDEELSPFTKVQYWRYLPQHPDKLSEVDDRSLTDMYERHVAEAVDYFQSRSPERFGLFNLDDRGLASSLSEFLNLKKRASFPREGSRKTFSSSLRTLHRLFH